MRRVSRSIRARGKTVGFVPTMGYFHAGHLALMKCAGELADSVVVSLFVNPTQFGENEDFDNYPRNLERDAQLAKDAGVDILFAPNRDDLYPKDFETYIIQKRLPMHLCGLSRPVHFTGVLTIVAKLFNIVEPDIAVFGEKDFQQLAVIRRMVRDLDFPVKIIGHEIVREPDGLAMSSRNTYLSQEQRKSALSLFKALNTAKELALSGCVNTCDLIETAKKIITEQKDTNIDYIKIVDPETLEDIQVINGPALMALAVFVGKTRLIDNMIIYPSDKG